MLNVFQAEIHAIIYVANPRLIYGVMLFMTFFWRLFLALYGMPLWMLIRTLIEILIGMLIGFITVMFIGTLIGMLISVQNNANF